MSTATSGLIDALDVAEQLRGRYEAAVLHAPALRFIGLWLKGRADEWVVPYPPNGTRLRNQETVSPGDVIGVLREMAGVIRNAANTGHARGN